MQVGTFQGLEYVLTPWQGGKRFGINPGEGLRVFDTRTKLDNIRTIDTYTPQTKLTDMVLKDTDLVIIRMAIQEGLEELTKLESRLYPRALEVDKLRGCFYALRQKFPRMAITLTLKNEIGKVCVTEPLGIGAVVQIGNPFGYLKYVRGANGFWRGVKNTDVDWVILSGYAPVLLSEGIPA